MEELTSIDFEILMLFQKKKRLHRDEIFSSLPYEEETLVFRIDSLAKSDHFHFDSGSLFPLPNTSYILPEYETINIDEPNAYFKRTNYFTLTAKGDHTLQNHQKELEEKKRLEFIEKYKFWLPFWVSVAALLMSAIALYISWIK